MIKIKTKKKVRQCHKQVEVSEKKRTIRENKLNKAQKYFLYDMACYIIRQYELVSHVLSRAMIIVVIRCGVKEIR